MDIIEPELQEYRGCEAISLDPYQYSTALSKILERMKAGLAPRIAVLDIDFTLTGNPRAAKAVRTVLDALGFVTVFATSRPSEMAMSRHEFHLSRRLGFNRLPPKLGTHEATKKRFLAFADDIESEIGLYNPDIIAGTTGTELFIRQNTGGFEKDCLYQAEMKEEPRVWKKRTRAVLKRLCRKVDPHGEVIHHSLVDDIKNYHNGIVDVAPPDYEVHLDFAAKTSTRARHVKEAFKKAFEDLKYRSRKYCTNPNSLNIYLTDDNTQSESGKYSIFFTPNSGNKDHAVETILHTLSQKLKIHKDEFEMIIIGDSYPDLRMGLWGGMDIHHGQNTKKAFRPSQVRFLLVGGSRLNGAFRMQSSEENEKINRILRDRLSEIETGIYLFETPFAHNRTIVVGDKKYPETRGPETILTFLEDAFKKELA